MMSSSDIDVPFLGDESTSGGSTEGDVESQTSSVSKQSKSKGPKGWPRKPVWCNMSPDQVLSFQKDYGIDPILETSEPWHQHPHLHYQRCYMETQALKMLDEEFPRPHGLWLDVGSNPRRVLAKSQTRCLVPIIIPGDAERYAPYKNEHRVCNHPLEEFVEGRLCQVCSLTFDALLFVHSAYYIRPSLLLAALKKTRSGMAVVIGHEFDVSGILPHKEALYHSEGLSICMKVHGNSHNYVHPRLPWEGTDHFVVDGVVVTCLLVRTLGSTKMWKLTLDGIQAPPMPKISWNAALVDPQYRGPISVPHGPMTDIQGLLTNDLIEFDVSHHIEIFGFGSGLLVTDRSKLCVMAPKSIIQRVATFMSYKTRDPSTFKACVLLANRLIVDATIPPHLVSQTAFICAAIGFNVNVQFESDVLATITAKYAGMWDLHSRMATLQPYKLVTAYVLLFLGLAFLGGSVVLDHFIDTPDHAIALIGTGLVLLILSLALCYISHRVAQRKASAEEWGLSVTVDRLPMYRDNPMSGVPLVIPPSEAFKPLQPIQAGAKIKLLPLDEDPEKKGLPIKMIGLGFDTVLPTVTATTREAEVVGINNRVLREKLPIQGWAMTAYLQVIDTNPAFAFAEHIKFEDRKPLRMRWQSRFPPAVQEQLRRAAESVFSRGPKRKDMDKKAFLKREKQVNLSADGEKPKNPRVISGPSDEAKVVLGPPCWEFSNQLAEFWDGVQVPILYARGRTSEYIGAALLHALNLSLDDAVSGDFPPGIIVIEDDFEVYDSSVGNDLRAPVERDYKTCGFSPRAIEMLSLDHNRGVSRRGVAFETEDRVISSGEAATNLVGTKVNVASHEAAVTHTQVGNLLLQIAGGDDFIGCLSLKQQNVDLIAAQLDAFMKGLGLRSSILIRLALPYCEFYSKLFWPTAEGLVLGPKPGRLLPKIGFSVDPTHGLAEFKGTLLSLQHDANHVPFVRKYISYMLRLIQRHNPRLVPKFSKSEEHEVHAAMTHKVCPLTWVFLERRYGVTESDERAFEELLRQISTLPAVIPVTPAISRMIELDA